MVAQTCVSRSSIWLWHRAGYVTKKISTTDGRRHRSTTRFYNGFGVDSMYMTTEGMDVQLCPRYEDSLTTWRSLPPPHLVPSLLQPHDTHHYSTDGLNRTG